MIRTRGLTATYWRVSLLLSMALLAPVANVSGGDTDDASQAEGRQLWLAVNNASIGGSQGDQLRSADSWRELLGKCFRVFFDHLEKASDRKHALEYFVDQFGRHGPHADIRWLMASGPITLPMSNSMPRFAMSAEEHPQEAWMYDAQLYVSKLLAERCLADKDFLARYYWSVLWSEQYLGPDQLNYLHRQELAVPAAIDSVSDGFADRPAAEEYYFARNGILLFYATGRDDLLKQAKPEDIKRRFDPFEKWFWTNWPYLRLDPDCPRWILDKEAQRQGERWKGKTAIPFIPIPRKPLPDWQGDVPPPARSWLIY